VAEQSPLKRAWERTTSVARALREMVCANVFACVRMNITATKTKTSAHSTKHSSKHGPFTTQFAWMMVQMHWRQLIKNMLKN